MELASKFIVVDGPDGSGKGTQLDRLQTWIEQGGAECVRAIDPGGTEVSQRIRHVLLGYDLSNVDPRCETLLFMASRAQLAAEVIRPALSAGKTVLCDRYISATCAYQVAAGFPREDVIQLGHLAIGTTWPDLTIVLNVPPEVGFARTGRTPRSSSRRAARPGQYAMFEGAAPDAMERRPLEFHRRVFALYQELPQVYPRPVVLVDATQAPDRVFDRITEEVRRAFP